MSLADLLAPFAQEGVLAVILGAGLFAKVILGVLLLFSILTWAVIIERGISFYRAGRQTASFLKLYGYRTDLEGFDETAQRLKRTPLSRVFRAALREWKGVKGCMSSNPLDRAHPLLDNVSSAMERAGSQELERLERGVVILATAGSTAPFLGLLGTVWGVMKSFLSISAKGSAHLHVVAPGIAEALITTVAGLVVAIPALIAYNYYAARVRRFSRELERFAAQLLDEFRLQLYR